MRRHIIFIIVIAAVSYTAGTFVFCPTDSFGQDESRILLTMPPLLAASRHMQPNNPTGPEKTVYAASTPNWFAALLYAGAGESWQQVIAAGTATVSSSSTSIYIDNLFDNGGGEYSVVSRSFLTFDLSALSKTDQISKAVLHLFTLSVTENPAAVQNIIAQQSTHSLPIEATDLRAFTGQAFGIASPPPADSTDIAITFNQDGIRYLQGVLGGYAKLVLRDSEYDYGTAAPPLHTHGYINFITPVTSDPQYKPRLVISF